MRQQAQSRHFYRYRAGVVGLRGVGLRELDLATTVEVPFNLLLLAPLAVEEGALDGLEAEDTPGGGYHLVDQIPFGWGGLVDLHLVVVKRLEAVVVIAFEDEGVA